MISIDKLILDFQKINSINSLSFKDKESEFDNLVFIGKFIESYNSNDNLNELLLFEIKNKSKLNILNAEVKEFVEKYELNNIFFQSIDLRIIENEILANYHNYELKITNLKKKEALKKYNDFRDLIKQNVSDVITKEDKELNLLNYQKARKEFEDISKGISKEISDIEEYVMENARYIYFQYEGIFVISNHIKTNLSKNLKEVKVYFDMYILGGIYKIYNNVLFEPTDEDTFRDFFNLIENSTALKIKERKITNTHHLINELYLLLGKSEKSNSWRTSILKSFGWDEAEHSKRYNILNRKAEGNNNKAIKFCNELTLILNKG